MKLATSYLESLGYDTLTRGRDMIVGHKLTVAGERESIVVFVPKFEPGVSFASQEGPYLSRFKQATKEYPRAQRFMLVPTYEGISRDFRNKSKTKYDFNIRVPILFFDTAFRIEGSIEARSAGSAAQELTRTGKDWANKRVPQPYEVIHGKDSERGDDLLATFKNNIIKGRGTNLNLIVAPAGMGKSVLYQVLFSHLYDEFQRYKSQLRIYRRPLPLIPEYLRSSLSVTLKGLIESFLHTEFAAPIGLDTFQWMLVNGFGIWLLDGLDEIVERDRGFFFDLLDILTIPGTVDPMIVMCLRDSLLTSNQELQDFIDEHKTNITIYELCKWGSKSKRIFAKYEFKGKQVDGFLSLLGEHKELNDLASTPFYCKLIAEQFADDRIHKTYNEIELLEAGISGIVEREYNKGLLDRLIISDEQLIELLQDLASEDASSGFQGLTIDTIKEYAEIMLPLEIEKPMQDKLVTELVQFALFQQGAVSGSVQFSQEILEQFLLGERIYRNILHNEEAAIRDLSLNFIPADWVTLRTVANRVIRDSTAQKLTDILNRINLPANTFRNVVQICAYSSSDPISFKRITFEGKSIAGIKMKDFDLRGVSFRNCDLTDVEFDGCLLNNTKYEGTIINRTLFLMKNKGDLKGAIFGDMGRIFSIKVQRRKPELNYESTINWLKTSSGQMGVIVSPCNAALQLRYLFGKFVYPDGKAKRAILDIRGALAGKEYYDKEKTIESVVRHGYLVKDTFGRGRLRRCDGDQYNEIINYVRDFTLTLGLETVLNNICSIVGCLHIPKIQTDK